MNRVRLLLSCAALCACLATAPAQAQQKLSYIVVNNLFSTPAYVAAENGYWAKQGLDVAAVAAIRRNNKLANVAAAPDW